MAFRLSAASDRFVDVRNGGDLPKGAVKAMHRGLDTTDQTCIDSYVALCTYSGEKCFGRACLVNGRLTAWFPWGGQEHCSSSEVQAFKILVDRGRDSQKGFKYVWSRLFKARKGGKCSPVVMGGYTPAVVYDTKLRMELLGKTKVEGEFAWTSYNGKENVHCGLELESCYVLCRKREL